jgi:beta-glucosidase
VNGKVMMDLWDWTEQGEAMFDGSKDFLFEVDMDAGVRLIICGFILNI